MAQEQDITRLDLLRHLIELDPEFSDRAMQLAQADPSGLGLENTPSAPGAAPQQIAPASMPTQQPDMMQQVIQQLNQNPKVLEQVVQQLQKDTLNTKPIGPDVIQGITGNPGGGGFFGLGIQPTDVLSTVLGVALTSGMSTDRAVPTMMSIAQLPAQYRQQQRNNLQQMLQQIIGVAAHDQRSRALQPVAGGVIDPRGGPGGAPVYTRTSPLSQHEVATNLAKTPEDKQVAAGLRQAPTVPGAVESAEREKHQAALPFKEADERRLRERESLRIGQQGNMRERIARLMQSLQGSEPTSLSKNVAEAERRLGRKLTGEEFMDLLKRSTTTNIWDVIGGIGGGSGGGSGGGRGGRNLSPEAEDLLNPGRR